MSWSPAQPFTALSVVDGIVVVDHGSNANYARPPAKRVQWVGSVEPNNAETGDVWIHNAQNGQALIYNASMGIFTNSAVELSPAVSISTTEPNNTSVLWLDTDDNPTLPFLVANHGSDADFARPNADLVQWRGTVAPNNAANGDLWYDTTGD